MHKEFHSLLSLEEARRMVSQNLPPAEEEDVPLEEALGRVLAETVVSGVDVPGYDRAAMDGYAVVAEDTYQAREDRPVELDLAGLVPMGQRPELSVAPGQAAEVSTGSMMPPGADSVVMVEHTQAAGGRVMVRRAAYQGENVLRAGSDILCGETVLAAGSVLGPREVGVLAAVGHSVVRVRKLTVGVASTGNELIPPGLELGPGQIYDINSYTVAAAARECGAAARVYGILPDDFQLMARRMEEISEECSLILVSGGTSAGAGDMLYRVVQERGELIFHGINLKPGKPTVFGRINGRPVFGLPGYPTSALAVFGQLAAPAIRQSLGSADGSAERVRARLARPIRSEGRHQMVSVGLIRDLAYPVDKGSGAITTLSQADGVVEVPSEVEYLDRGETVEVQLFGRAPGPDLVIAGEDCPALETLAGSLGLQVRLINNGSRRGRSFLEDGLADLACLSSPGTGAVPERGEALVRGYRRELGLMARDPALLKPGRKARILGWSRDAEMSRTMREALQDRDLDLKVTGQARSHRGLARAVALGRADLGFGSLLAAREAGLAYAGLAEDRIDFLVRVERLEDPGVKAFLAALKALDLPGTAREEDGGEVVLRD
ncbi:MAG: molybdopterin biosynthesis protein [Methanosarcinales archaeon]|nr:molybdopterin biosynthesis protein [Methanosarcinales archaeon]